MSYLGDGACCQGGGVSDSYEHHCMLSYSGGGACCQGPVHLTAGVNK